MTTKKRSIYPTSCGRSGCHHLAMHAMDVDRCEDLHLQLALDSDERDALSARTERQLALVSLYKALLFTKIAEALKGGALNLALI